MTRLPTKRSTRFLLSAALLAVFAAAASAQTPLDMQVLDERLTGIESQLRGLQGAGFATGLQMPTAPEEAGSAALPLPTDVASRLQVRVLQLERLVETLTGQVEETRFEVSQMRAQLLQLSNDVSYRLAVLEQAAGVSSAISMPNRGMTQGTQQPVQTTAPVAQNAPTTVPMGEFSRQPPSTTTVSGFPGTVNSSGRVAADLSMPLSSPVQPQPQMVAPTQTPAGTQLLAPGEIQTAPVQSGPINQGNIFGVVRIDAGGNTLPPEPGATVASDLPPTPQQQIAAVPPRLDAAPTPGPVVAARIGMAPDLAAALTELPAGTPKEQYDYAFDILRKADYARAESALRMFLQANPTDTLAGNAQYWLGETLYVRGDFEQAAVEFLSGYQTYSSGNKAPDNLLKLGLSLARLGQTDGACTALTRLATEYPEANDTIRRRAQTERALLNCS
jgi:tol-pal system protein YbgF